MKLFLYPGACSLIPHIALEEIGKPYETVTVDFATGEQLSPEYLAINPKGRVPALAVDRGVITEIPAILGYLALTYPEAGLAPVGDAFEFAQVQSFHLYMATTIHVLFRQISRPEVYADGEEVHAALKAKVPEMSDHYFQYIEALLSDGRHWVHGDHYTSSDIYLYVFSSYLNMGDRGDPEKIPHVWAHRSRVARRPAVVKAVKDEGVERLFLHGV